MLLDTLHMYLSENPKHLIQKSNFKFGSLAHIQQTQNFSSILQPLIFSHRHFPPKPSAVDQEVPQGLNQGYSLVFGVTVIENAPLSRAASIQRSRRVKVLNALSKSMS